MSLHINRFVDRIKAAESRSQRDVSMTINEARDLHADITKLLLVLQGLQEQIQQTQTGVTIELNGGDF
jgi:hypothetical protein